MKKVLIPVTNHPTLGSTDQPNGTYAPELTHVVAILNAHNIGFDIASLSGGKAPLYGTDIEDDQVNTDVLSNPDFMDKVNNTLVISKLDIESYDAIFYPGGFGLLNDLAEDKVMASLAATHYENGGIIAAVCHGPAALLPITLSSGELLLADKKVTSFTREEEVDFGTIEDIPFLLEESLTRKAAQFNKVQPWQSFVIEDDRLITGQNPASAHAVGELLVSKIAR
ncbi:MULTISPECIES: type 1 glutamine amidotransferase domain-containing protein [Pseudoalteromonas]|uniref:Putative intracellular protease/amidase n=1 Tax=Pseudoalteromonas luteoviolacea (strain 2ta16) TaxID=1353533 RepID=V4GZN8_PSEL2|nr:MULTISPECIES: type 1 glutamine amidotransferase domain-containing protein [Pseudoalteromonas]ESP90661.1 putative intracellular protease/amidase [Pseudoalteromonas luteoviolacea 2ta16]KZN41763.1 hypothetical protein N483_13920 [Pseudoalteromonas luteoviolacea NCIMB 1944]MCG7548078.1 type 1 glutamine amidotransferase domain-containing protein [Pseudoalteromonas sp. Of7M-16]